jgi:hypothetical protein
MWRPGHQKVSERPDGYDEVRPGLIQRQCSTSQGSPRCTGLAAVSPHPDGGRSCPCALGVGEGVQALPRALLHFDGCVCATRARVVPWVDETALGRVWPGASAFWKGLAEAEHKRGLLVLA